MRGRSTAIPPVDLGDDRRQPPGLGTGRRRERHPVVITSRANGRVKAARALGEAKERRRTGLFTDEGEDALRAALAAGIAPVEAFVDDDLGSDRIADELKAAGTTVLRCTTQVMEALSALSHTSRAVGIFRANDLPPLEAGVRPLRSGCSCTASPTPATSARCCAARRASAPPTWRWPTAAPTRSRRARCERAWARSTAVPVITLREAPPLPTIALDARAEQTLAAVEPHRPGRPSRWAESEPACRPESNSTQSRASRWPTEPSR